MVKRRRLSDSSIDPAPDLATAKSNTSATGPRVAKRRYFGKSHLLDLPQELILRIFHFLPAQTLLTVSRTSHKLHLLASDPQLWKSKFWARFIHPRLQRRAKLQLPETFGQGNQTDGSSTPSFSNDWKLWLDDHKLVQEERDLVAQHPIIKIKAANQKRKAPAAVSPASHLPSLDWKSKFKLRSNWQRGNARSERVSLLAPIDLKPPSDAPNDPFRGPLIVGRYYEGYFISVDRSHGIRVFDCSSQTELARREVSLGHPICLNIEENLLNEVGRVSLARKGIDFVVGYQDGAYSVHHFDTKSKEISEKFIQRASDPKAGVEFVSFSYPYLVTVTSANRISIWCFRASMAKNGSPGEAKHSPPPPNLPLLPPTLISESTIDSTWIPVNVSFRKDLMTDTAIASVVFSIRSATLGCSITVQEIHLPPPSPSSLDSKLLKTQVATPPLYDALDQAFFGRSANLAFTTPTCVSYRYPFIMTSHADNTIVLYTCFTTDEGKLEIGAGHRLWGHNTAVMAVQVGLQRAVSVDRRGEVRVWDLQGRFERAASSRDRSVRILGSGDPIMLNLGGKQGVKSERGLVGFGEEEAVVMEKEVDLDNGTTNWSLAVFSFR